MQKMGQCYKVNAILIAGIILLYRQIETELSHFWPATLRNYLILTLRYIIEAKIIIYYVSSRLIRRK